MANISNYLEEVLLNHVFRNINYASPGATHYVALFSSTKDTDELEANDASGEITAYAEADREPVEFDEATPFQTGGKATLVSNMAVEYTVMPAVLVRHLAICDNATHGAGNILYWMQLNDDRDCAAGDACRFPAGNISLDLD